MLTMVFHQKFKVWSSIENGYMAFKSGSYVAVICEILSGPDPEHSSLLTEKVTIESYYFNIAEQTRIIRALAMYYMYKSLRSKGTDSFLELIFEKSQGQNIVEIQEKVTYRAEFEVLREFMENRVLNTRFKRG